MCVCALVNGSEWKPDQGVSCVHEFSSSTATFRRNLLVDAAAESPQTTATHNHTETQTHTARQAGMQTPIYTQAHGSTDSIIDSTQPTALLAEQTAVSCPEVIMSQSGASLCPLVLLVLLGGAMASKKENDHELIVNLLVSLPGPFHRPPFWIVCGFRAGD